MQKKLTIGVDFRLFFGYFKAMIWQPKYTITDRLLSTIREIGEVMGALGSRPLRGQELITLAQNASALSTYASTSIEGNPLPLTDVKRLIKSSQQHVRDSEREVLNYNQALETLYAQVEQQQFTLDLNAIATVQATVTQGLLNHPDHCGKVRKEAVVIRNPRQVDEIVFIPPDAKDVSALMQALLDYIQKNIGVVDPIILAGLFHKQCVIIHPFMDGNGRTTRLITTALLGMTGLNLFKLFSFEQYYNNNISRYFQQVGLVGDYYEWEGRVDFTSWLEYFAEGVLDELKRAQKAWSILSAASRPRLESHHQVFLAYIEEHGSITQREYGEISARSLAARKQDVERLRSLGLIEPKGRGRATHYIMVK